MQTSRPSPAADRERGGIAPRAGAMRGAASPRRYRTAPGDVDFTGVCVPCSRIRQRNVARNSSKVSRVRKKYEKQTYSGVLKIKL